MGGEHSGYRAASLRYFGLEPARLSWAQAATLAVLPNNPAYVNPMRNREQLRKKRDSLLNSLLEAEVIDAETYFFWLWPKNCHRASWPFSWLRPPI